MAGLLGEVYSYIDSKKRGLLDAFNNPGDALQQFVGNLGDSVNQSNDMMQRTGLAPTVYGKTNATQQQQALARALLAEQGAQMGIAGSIGGKFVYPQEKALATAQKNAALPVELGGLGLHPNNTPAERAQAMGFDADSYHGTQNVFDNFDLSKSNSRSQYMPGAFTSDTPDIANIYAGDGVVMPLAQKNGYTVFSKVADRRAGKAVQEVDSIYDKTKGIRVTNNLSNIRSRFAAFDPTLRDSSDLLAGMLPLSAMADDDQRKKISALLGN